MFATLSTAWVLPGVLGPAIAGVVGETLGWRYVFLGLLPLIAAAGCSRSGRWPRSPANAVEASATEASPRRTAGGSRTRSWSQPGRDWSRWA